MSLYTRFVSAAMRATRPRSLPEARRTMRLAAAEWRRRRHPNPPTPPREQLAFMQGRRAYNIGRPLSSNPYVPGSAVAAAWADGWHLASTPYRSNPRKKKRPAVGGEWQPDLFGGAGIQRPEGATRAEQLALARQEMRDAGARDLFDVLAERQGNPGRERRERLTQRYRELSRNPRRRNPAGDSLLTYFLIGGLVYFFVVRGKGLDSVATPLGLNPFNQ